MAVTRRPRQGPVEHRWVDGECMVCGLRRRELWVSDRQRRPVIALLWWHPRLGGIAVRQFAFMLGDLPPAAGGLQSLQEALPNVPEGSEPPCRP